MSLVFFHCSHSDGYFVASLCLFNLHFLTDDDIHHFLMCLLVMHESVGRRVSSLPPKSPGVVSPPARAASSPQQTEGPSCRGKVCRTVWAVASVCSAPTGKRRPGPFLGSGDWRRSGLTWALSSSALEPSRLPHLCPLRPDLADWGRVSPRCCWCTLERAAPSEKWLLLVGCCCQALFRLSQGGL